MKKIIFLVTVFLVGSWSLSYANLTNGYAVITKNGSLNPPTTQNGSIFDTGTSGAPGNVGIGSTNPGVALDVNGTVRALGFIGPSAATFFKDSASTGHVDYVGCSDNIATVIAGASVGDTIQLGKCHYLQSAVLSLTGTYHINGMGKYETIIDLGSNSIGAITTTAALNLSNLSIIGTNLPGAAVNLNFCGGACQQSVSTGAATTTSANHITNVYINVSGPSTVTGVLVNDGGVTISNSYIVASTATYTSGDQDYAVAVNSDASNTADIYTYINDSTLFNNSTDLVGNSGSIVRGIRFYNYINTNPFHMYLFVDKSTIKIRDFSNVNPAEACHNQGANIVSYWYNSTCDGDYQDLTPPYTSNLRVDMRCDDGAICNLYGTTMVSGQVQDNDGGISPLGQFNGSSINLAQAPSEGVQPNGVQAPALISGTGGVGGNGTGSGSATSGAGASVNLVGGNGGIVTIGTGTATGGGGGNFIYTGGAGGAQADSNATNDIGGVGGNTILLGGAGGAAQNGTTTNVGGNGGSEYLVGGAAGVGVGTGSATGSSGNVYLAITSGGTARGEVGVRTVTASQMPQAFNVNGNIYTNGNIGIGTLNPIAPFQVFENGTGLINKIRNNVAQGAGSGSTFSLEQDDGTSPTSGNRIGQILFQAANNTSHNIAGGAVIAAYFAANWTGTSDPTNLEFGTAASGSQVATPTMALDSNGNLGIGGLSPSQRLDVNGTVNAFVVTSAGNVGINSLTPGQALDVQGTIRSSLGYISGTTPGINCSGSPDSSFTVVKGIVTAC